MSDDVLDNAMVPSFTTKPSGSGMGLTLCREIVDAHRGRLRIARRDGGGIAVSFWLPPRDAPAGAGQPRHADPDAQLGDQDTCPRFWWSMTRKPCATR